MLRMAQLSKIHKGKPSSQLHYLVEWAEHRGLKQADIVKALDVDKSTVSRWFDGTLPSEQHLIALAGYLFAEDYEPEPAALFRHPNDDWMFRLLRGRSTEEIERIRATIEAAFPRKAA
jgi:transcriptional regulator with XRE-family HTH domain